MSTPPTATPRTDNAWRRYNRAELPDPLELVKEMNALETELAAASQAYDCAMAIHGTVLEDLAAEREKVRVLRSTLERRHDEQSYHCQYVEDALAAADGGSMSTTPTCGELSCDECNARTATLETELARLRAELAVSENWVEHHSKHADDLIGENVKLRADLERFTGHGLLDCHAICDQRDAAVAERDRLRVEVERLKELLRIESASAQHALAAAERAEASAKLWEADALRYANNTEFWKDRAEKAEAALTDPQQLHAHCLRTLNEGQIAHLFGERMTEIVNRAEKSERLWKEFITLMEITEESDSGYAFNPNKISSCRAIDGKRLNEILNEARQIVF